MRLQRFPNAGLLPTSLWLLLLLLPTLNDGREYHYDRPQTPFPIGSHQQHHAASGAHVGGQHFVIGSSSGRHYEVEMLNSQRIYEGHAATAAAGTGGGHSGLGHSGGGTYSGGYSNGYTNAGSRSYPQPANGRSLAQQPPTTPHVNPLLGSGRVDYAYNPPQYAQHQYAGSQATAYAGGQASSRYAGPQQAAYHAGGHTGRGYAAATGQAYGHAPSAQGHPSAQYAQQQQQHTHGGGRSIQAGSAYNAQQHQQQQQQYYAGAAHAQQGGGSFTANGVQSGAAQLSTPINANGAAGFDAAAYRSQSEAGQLDAYAFKQARPGDPRAFQRLVTICYPGGQCERVDLAAGQVDQRQLQITQNARGQVAPASDKCRRIAEAQAAAANAAPGTYAAPLPAQLDGQDTRGGQAGVGGAAQSFSDRPRDRRLFPYSEIARPIDNFN